MFTSAVEQDNFFQFLKDLVLSNLDFVQAFYLQKQKEDDSWNRGNLDGF